MKERLDAALVRRGLTQSRERAKALIMAGKIYVGGLRSEKAGTMVREEDTIELRGGDIPFVSRGGLKLDKAIKAFDLSLEGCVCMDIGASTGGFTDCMLQNGAAKVYAVDVGYGQLAWKLREDARVVNLERTNVRHLTDDQVPERIAFATADVSFISLSHVLPVIRRLLCEDGRCVCLIKPQFEAGKDQVGRRGVVRDPEVHRAVIERVLDLARGQGFSVRGLDYSPVRGPEGNIEYLVYLQQTALPDSVSPDAVDCVVTSAHEALTQKGAPEKG